MGAEDGDPRAETVRSGAADRVGVEYTQAAWIWRLGMWGIGEGLHEQRSQGMAAFGVLSFLVWLRKSVGHTRARYEFANEFSSRRGPNT
jgi:hypothetical protein